MALCRDHKFHNVCRWFPAKHNHTIHYIISISHTKMEWSFIRRNLKFLHLMMLCAMFGWSKFQRRNVFLLGIVILLGLTKDFDRELQVYAVKLPYQVFGINSSNILINRAKVYMWVFSYSFNKCWLNQIVFKNVVPYLHQKPWNKKKWFLILLVML